MTQKIMHFGPANMQKSADAISIQVRSYPATGKESETISIEVPYLYQGESRITKLVLDVPSALRLASQVVNAVANKY